MKPLENNVGKGENAGNQHFLLFPAMFSTPIKRNFRFLAASDLSSANAFSLVKSKMIDLSKSESIYGRQFRFGLFSPLPNDKILDWFKFKAFPDDKINVT